MKWDKHLKSAGLAFLLGYFAVNAWLQSRFNIDIEKLFWDVLATYGISGVIGIILVLWFAYLMYSKAYRG